MKAELLTTQRRLVSRRLKMADGEVYTKYVFPFVDDSWSVPFYVIDAMTYGPRFFRGTLKVSQGGLATPEPVSKLEKLSSLSVDRFGQVVHFDPWRVFRGVAGVERAIIDAVLASNIAGTFNHEGTTYKLHDLDFDSGLKTLEVLRAKDPVFRDRSFVKGDLGLLQLRGPPRK